MSEQEKTMTVKCLGCGTTITRITDERKKCPMCGEKDGP